MRDIASEPDDGDDEDQDHEQVQAEGQRTSDGLYDVRAGARDARNLFAFSILYLALIFATLLVEHLMGVKPLELLVR